MNPQESLTENTARPATPRVEAAHGVPLTLTQVTSDEVITIAIDGELDMASAPTLAAHVSSLISSGVDRIVLDCTKLTFLDSSGIAVLLTAWHQMKDRAQMPVVLENVQPNIKRVLDVVGLSHLTAN